MKAALLYQDKDGLMIEEIADPVPVTGEVKVKVLACGVCGTDVHLVEKHIPTTLSPVVPGHEIVGEVVELGTNTRSNFSVGERVLIFPQIFCGECYACQAGNEELCVKAKILGINRHGGFAEYICVPERTLMPAPSVETAEEAALYAESVGVVYHAIFVRGNLVKGETALVSGIGGLGTNAIKLMKALGDVTIIALDTSTVALERAAGLGADHCINPMDFKDNPKELKKAILAVTNGCGADIAFEFVGIDASIQTAYRALKRGGRLVLVGVGMHKQDFGPLVGLVASGRSIIASFGYSKKSASDLLKFTKDHNLSFADSVTQSFSLDQAAEAIAKLQSGSGECVRLVVSPHKGEN